VRTARRGIAKSNIRNVVVRMAPKIVVMKMRRTKPDLGARRSILMDRDSGLAGVENKTL
jgi:hypothetical protein